MKLLGILACLAMLGISLGGWNAQYSIYEGRDALDQHSVFLDTSTNKAHIVFFQYEKDNIYYYYMALSANGEATRPKRLLDAKAIPYTLFFPSITGSNDGRHIFVTLNALRTQERDYPELFFMESSSDGLYFTDPIIPRSNDIEDTTSRWHPQLVRTKSNRLIITYRKEGKLTYSMRSPYSTIWSPERTLNLTPEPVRGHYTISYSTDDHQECICVGALYNFANPLASHVVMYTTTTGGAVWESYDYLLDSRRSFDFIYLAYSAATQRVLFSPLEYRSNDASVLYEWKNHEIDVVAIFPVTSYVALPEIEVCNITGVSYIFYFADAWMGSYQDRLLVLIPEEKPYAFQRLPAPAFGAQDWNIRLYCHHNTLFATGIDFRHNYHILGANYTFPF